MIRAFSAVQAKPDEVTAARAGDGIVAEPDVVMDRAFTVGASPDMTWPWLLQLGKRRAGWYLPRSVERFIPPSRRAARTINPAWQRLHVGDVIPDYGGRNETFEVVILNAPAALVYRSRRRQTSLTWSITQIPAPGSGPYARPATRIHLRLRLGPVRHRWLAETGGELIDLLTIAGMAAGLRERLQAKEFPPRDDGLTLADSRGHYRTCGLWVMSTTEAGEVSGERASPASVVSSTVWADVRGGPWFRVECGFTVEGGITRRHRLRSRRPVDADRRECPLSSTRRSPWVGSMAARSPVWAYRMGEIARRYAS